MQQLIKSPTDMTAEELGQLREDMILLVRDYAQWAENQPPEWSPKLIGTMNQSQARSAGTIYWPGRLESYFDRECRNEPVAPRISLLQPC